jgi:hypothetical protein
VLQLAPVADPLVVAHGMTLYAWRSTLERKRALRDAEQERRQRDGYDVAGEGPVEDELDESPEEELEVPAAEGGSAYFPDSPRARSTST